MLATMYDAPGVGLAAAPGRRADAALRHGLRKDPEAPRQPIAMI